MHEVSYEPDLQKSQLALRGLPRGHPPPPVRRKLRELPLGGGMAGFKQRHPRSLQSLSAYWRTCSADVRGLPQERRSWAILRTLDRLLLMPPAGLSDSGHRSRVLGFSDYLRELPYREYVVQREI